MHKVSSNTESEALAFVRWAALVSYAKRTVLRWRFKVWAVRESLVYCSCHAMEPVVFQTRGLATAKLLSPNWVLVRGTTHGGALADRRRRPTSATNRQLSEMLWRCETMYVRTANLNSTRRRSGSE